MNIKLIKTERDYQQAPKRLEIIFGAKLNSKEGDELEILTMLIEKYENKKYPITAPDPIEAIKFRMEQLDYDKKDLEKIIGSKGTLLNIKKSYTELKDIKK